MGLFEFSSFYPINYGVKKIGEFLSIRGRQKYIHDENTYLSDDVFSKFYTEKRPNSL
jgi:hypothetical protein